MRLFAYVRDRGQTEALPGAGNYAIEWEGKGKERKKASG